MNRPRAYEGTEPYIFISYAHKDSETVLPIITALQDRGFRVWYDAGIEAGTEWPEYIAEHLDGCTNFVAFVSESSLGSHNCRREINFAIELQKDPLVVYLEEVKMSLGMRMQLGSLQAMYRNRHSTLDSFMNELCRSKVLTDCRSNAMHPSAICGNSKKEINEWYDKGLAYYYKHEFEESVKWYRKAAECGHADAQFNLGLCYRDGYGVDEDMEEAAKWHRKAAEQGHEGAQIRIAFCYRFGLGVERDRREMVKWYQKCANLGNPEAQWRLGDCYRNGDGVEQNLLEAIRWYREAAEHGDCQAQCDLGCCFRDGIGTEQNHSEAFAWFKKAAEQGFANGQNLLAECYQLGIGVRQDISEAVKWFKLAAAQGSIVAKVALEEMGVVYENKD